MHSTSHPLQRIEGETKPVKMCEKCRALLDSREDTSATVRAHRVPMLRSESQFAEYGAVSSDVRHWARQDGILALYNTKETTRKVVCSFPDHVRHYDGAIVKTICGIVVKIGNVCASHWIEEYDRAHGFMLRQEAMTERLDALKSEPDSLATELKELLRRANWLGELRGRFERLLREVADEMTRRQTDPQGPNSAVTYLVRTFVPETGEHKLEPKTEHIAGLEWWDPRASVERIESAASQAQELAAAVKSESLEDEGVVARLHRWLQAVQESRREADHWVSSRESFFGSRNVKLVLLATRSNRIEAAGRRFRFHREGRVCLLGLDGFSFE